MTKATSEEDNGSDSRGKALVASKVRNTSGEVGACRCSTKDEALGEVCAELSLSF
jgi:hypothetical protein